MYHFVRRADLQESSSRTAEFQGAPYGAGVSFFLVDNDPGQGPSLHQHAYPETWIVQMGQARFTVGDDSIEVVSGDIVVVPPHTPHKFINLGPDNLAMVCIHAAERIENLPVIEN